MAINNLTSTFQLAQTTSLSGATTAASPTAGPVSTTPVGTRANPYVLQSNSSWVNWNTGSKPEFISYKGNTYEFEAKEGSKTLRYESIKRLPYGQNNLRITFSGESKQ